MEVLLLVSILISLIILLIIGVFSNLIARPSGEYLKQRKKTYVVYSINIVFLLLFVALFIPYMLRSQINVIDGVTELEKKQIAFVLDVDKIIVNTNLWIRWISLFTSLVGWYATSNKLHRLICVLNIIIGVSYYSLYGLAFLLGGSSNIF